ncbi:collagen alpha-2(I) chain-like [Choloepus didactylus]|uniref:collagen alpha-2(I) chain-like n=1 Tax=Choloepus didactylus TaxID=27675 RepID=UPI0018A0601C|nr:collagen alpha-2(I) chain-like [Choloepus didactylus]
MRAGAAVSGLPAPSPSTSGPGPRARPFRRREALGPGWGAGSTGSSLGSGAGEERGTRGGSGPHRGDARSPPERAPRGGAAWAPRSGPVRLPRGGKGASSAQPPRGTRAPSSCGSCGGGRTRERARPGQQRAAAVPWGEGAGTARTGEGRRQAGPFPRPRGGRLHGRRAHSWGVPAERARRFVLACVLAASVNFCLAYAVEFNRKAHFEQSHFNGCILMIAPLGSIEE